MKKRKNKKKKSHVDNEFDFGVREFTCIKCGHALNVDMNFKFPGEKYLTFRK
ncbi:hypothetical protein [Clostridium tagluense]|uniref:hypothetical protein n=1 Tax=Clostridium tagluense TaxID=360422 RepID=UPI001C6EF559|nr:hypothetical protein [Clostridium tagluense]MBW9155909.1 hypothetical protein [Clostridium tagluense]WLC63960.1 hypothetical protein KTC93_13845 [Clostridium tagluense]